MSTATPNGFNLDNSGRRIVVDPVTRIEGHLRVEVNLDANNVIRNAVSTGTMWRGLEVILQGPRSARRLGLHRAHLRRLHRHPRADLGARGRGRARHHDPRERQHHPQHHAADAAGPRPPGALLPPARARLGRRGQRAEGRPARRPRSWRSRSRAGRMSSPGYFRDLQSRLQEASSSPASSARSATATGATRRTSCRRKPT